MGFKSGFNFLVFSLFVAILNLATYSLALDFDNDKIDDVIYVTINKDKTLSWRYRSSKLKRLVAIGRYGSAGNNLIPGVWNGSNTPILATVSESSSNTLWSFRANASYTLSNNPSSFTLGSSSALVISGADLNADKNLDPIAIDIENSVFKWKTFSGTFGDASSLRTSTFGSTGDLPFIWKNFNGSSDYALIVNDHITSPTVFTLSANDSIRTFNLSESPKYNKAPFTVIYGRRTFLVFPLVEKTKTTFTIFRDSGSLLRKITVNTSGELLVGNFTNLTSGQEIGIQSGKIIYLVSLGTSKVNRMSGFSGIPVDEINISSASKFNNIPTEKLSASCYLYSSNDGYKRGFIWKPNSDTQRFSVTVLPNEFTNKTSSIELYSGTTGEFIKTVTSKGCGNADDQGPRCAYQDKQFTGQEYQAKYGTLLLKAAKNDGTCAVFKIDTPGKRVD